MSAIRLVALLLILSFAAPAAAIVVTPARPVFQTGDTIEFSAHNNSFATLHFPSSAPFILRNITTGEEFSFTAATVIIDLEPGSTESFQVSSGNLTSGTYEIVLEYYDDNWEKFTAFATFIFETAVGVQPVSTGGLKLRFGA